MPDSSSETLSSASRQEAASSTSRGEAKSLPTLVTELWELVVSYAKQQTVEPLKGLGRFLAWGVPGAIVTTLGLVLLFLAGLRATQTESSFDRHLSWLPYLIVIVGAGLVAGLAARAITRPKRKKGL